MNEGTVYGAYHQNMEDVLIAYQMDLKNNHSDDNVTRVLIDRMGAIVGAYPQVQQDSSWIERWNAAENEKTPIRNSKRFELLQQALVGKGILVRLQIPRSRQHSPGVNGNGQKTVEGPTSPEVPP